jgi:hypothetical protein
MFLLYTITPYSLTQATLSSNLHIVHFQEHRWILYIGLAVLTFTAMDIHVSSNNRLADKVARFLCHVPSQTTHEVTHLDFLQSAYRRPDSRTRYGKRKMSTFAVSESITLTTAVIAYSTL